MTPKTQFWLLILALFLVGNFTPDHALISGQAAAWITLIYAAGIRILIYPRLPSAAEVRHA